MVSKFAKVDKDHFNWWRRLAQYFAIYCVLYPFFLIFFRIEVHGRENIPKGKALLVAANHTSYFDPVIIAVGTSRPVAYMAKEELFHVPVLSQIIQILGAFAVNRKKLEVATIKSAKKVLSDTDWMLGIFPEGTRVKPGRERRITRGFGYLAKMTNAEILPFGIILERKTCPMWGKAIVKIGKPLPVPESPQAAIESWSKAIEELTGIKYTSEQEETKDSVPA